MTDLKCLLLTQDRDVVDVVKPALVGAGIVPQLIPNPEDALESLRTSHFDGVVIDYAGISESMDLISQIRNGRSNCHSVILAIVDGRTNPNTILQRGANFVLQKPVSKDLIASYARIALVFLNREFRRYLRYSIDLPVTVTTQAKTVQAKAVNVSEQGLGLELAEAAELKGQVHVRFVIPGSARTVIDAKAEIAWIKNSKAGIRFVAMGPQIATSFHAWLDQLYAQRSSVHS
jgi:DNA-binding response OmpR family regulator